MKILVVQDYLRSGGTERQSILLANAFAAAGQATTLLTFRPGGALAPSLAPSVSRVVLQPFDSGLDFWAPRLGAGARRIQPDVVLCMGRMANCRAGFLQTRLPRAAVVATLRTGKPLPWLYRRSLRAARQVVANSTEARSNLLAREKLPPDKVCVIHNALVFAQPVAPDQRAALRREFGAGDHTTVLLDVAMFRPEKNQRELIEIAAGLPADFDWQLWLAGDGPSRAACEALAAEKTRPGSVRFLGWQKNPAPYYAAADIAVHASTSEALSNFLIEAQAFGLPAVATLAQGVTECFQPGQTGVAIAPGDRESFRRQIVDFGWASAETRAERSRLAREFSLSTFDHDRQVARYLQLFQQLRS